MSTENYVQYLPPIQDQLESLDSQDMAACGEELPKTLKQRIVQKEFCVSPQDVLAVLKDNAECKSLVLDQQAKIDNLTGQIDRLSLLVTSSLQHLPVPVNPQAPTQAGVGLCPRHAPTTTTTTTTVTITGSPTTAVYSTAPVYLASTLAAYSMAPASMSSTSLPLTLHFQMLQGYFRGSGGPAASKDLYCVTSRLASGVSGNSLPDSLRSSTGFGLP